MADYRFCVSLRVTHPSLDPDEVTRTLGIEPFRQWMVGEPRLNHEGKPLEGVSRETFWAANLHDKHRLCSKNVYLEDFLKETNQKLKPHTEYFSGLVKSGGYVEYFIGWFGEYCIGATLDPELMNSTSSLSIAIGLDIYVGEE